MNKKVNVSLIFILFMILLVGITAISAVNQSDTVLSDNNQVNTKVTDNKNSDNSIYVTSKGNSVYDGKDINKATTIGKALNNVKDNDTIFLISKTNDDKYENLSINTSLKNNIHFTIEGQKDKHILLDGQNMDLLVGKSNSTIIFRNLEICNYGNIHLANIHGDASDHTSLIFDNCTLYNNGVIQVNDNANLSINNSIFYDNHAESIIFKDSLTNDNSLLLINNSVFRNHGNSLINTLSNSIISNVTFIDNKNEFGNIINNHLANMTIINSTFISNNGIYIISNTEGSLNYIKNYDENNKAIYSYLYGNNNRSLYNSKLVISSLKNNYQSNEVLKLKALLFNEINHNLDNYNVTFIISGNNLTENVNVTINNHTALYNFYIPKNYVGQLSVKAIFNDDVDKEYYDSDLMRKIINLSKYNSSTSNILSVNVTPINAKITLTTSSNQVSVDDSIILKAFVNSSKIVSGKVIFKMDNKTLKDKNGKVIKVKLSNNTAILNYTIPDGIKKGDHKFSAVFGNDEYKRLSDDKIVNIKAIDIIISYPNKITTTERKILINGTVKDINGHYIIGNNKMHIKLNGVCIKNAHGSPIVIVAKNGRFSQNIILPINIGGGIYKVTIVTGARTSYNLGRNNGTLIYKPNIILKQDTSICNNSITHYRCRVTDSKNNNITTGKVIFYSGQDKIGQARVINGQAILRIESIEFKTSTMNITVTYCDSKGNEIIEKTSKVRVVPPKVSLNLDIPQRVQRGSKVEIKSFVKSSDGNNVCSGYVEYTLQGTLTGKVKVVNGLAKLSCIIPEYYLGRNYIFTAIFISQNYDVTLSNSTRLTITK